MNVLLNDPTTLSRMKVLFKKREPSDAKVDVRNAGRYLECLQAIEGFQLADTLEQRLPLRGIIDE